MIFHSYVSHQAVPRLSWTCRRAIRLCIPRCNVVGHHGQTPVDYTDNMITPDPARSLTGLLDHYHGRFLGHLCMQRSRRLPGTGGKREQTYLKTAVLPSISKRFLWLSFCTLPVWTCWASDPAMGNQHPSNPFASLFGCHLGGVNLPMFPRQIVPPPQEQADLR